MKRIILTIVGLLLPRSAHCYSAESLGTGADGITDMWNMAADFLPWRNAGGNAIVNIYGSGSSYGIIIVSIINGVLWLIGGAAVILIMWGGIQMIISGLNEEELNKGKKTLLYAIAGLILALLGEVIVWMVYAFAFTLGS